MWADLILVLLTLRCCSQLNNIYRDAANSHVTATSMILFTFNTKSLNTAMISEPIRIQQSLHKCQSQLWKLDHTRMGAVRNYKGLISFCCASRGRRWQLGGENPIVMKWSIIIVFSLQFPTSNKLMFRTCRFLLQSPGHGCLMSCSFDFDRCNF